MKIFKNTMLPLLLIIFTSCKKGGLQRIVSSPSGNNVIEFHLSMDGPPSYRVIHNSSVVIDTSFIGGFDFKNQKSLKKGFKIENTTLESKDETWEMPWGEQRKVRNHYNDLKIQLKEEEGLNRVLNIHFKAYDDGIAFRYEFPKQKGRDSITIMDEHTEFQLTEDHTAFWIPGDWDTYEHLYQTSFISEIDALAIAENPSTPIPASYIPENAVNTPVTMRSSKGLHLAFHEADLTDYAGMTLKVDTTSLKLTTELVGSARLGYKVKTSLPARTPWRSIQIADVAGGLIESRLIENLNEPNKLGDVSWFTPMKYVGIWWEMQLGLGTTIGPISTWKLEGTQDMSTDHTPGAEGKVIRHGANTENVKRYIDFASANGFKGVLVEGWNTGWNNWFGIEDREGVFDFVTPYNDFDIDGINAYANKNGVEMIMHHETSSAPRTYEKQMKKAYELMQKHNMHCVKSGYVGKIIPKGEYHHGQWMVNHYRKALEMAAKYKVAVNAHEPIKGTGLRRTYPNMISKEGVRVQEFNAWSQDGGNPPEHLPIVAFTRMISGPIDFTPGVFDIDLPTKPDNQINTTLANPIGIQYYIFEVFLQTFGNQNPRELKIVL